MRHEHLLPIIIDGRCLQDERFAGRGIGIHTRGLIFELSKMRSYNENIFIQIILQKNANPLCDGVEEFVDLVSSQSSFFKPDRPSIFINPSPMTFTNSAIRQFLNSDKIIKIAVLYDFIPYDFPGYTNSKEVIDTYRASIGELSNYDFYFSISESTKQRAIQLLNIKGDDIKVTGIPRKIEMNFSSAEIERLGTKIPHPILQQPYLVVSGGDDIRKNPEIVCKALKILTSRTGKNIPTIFLGHFPMLKRSLLFELAKHDILNECQLYFPEYLSTSEYFYLIKKSSALIVPSFSEGFSIPIIEGFSAGVPVIASDIPAHRELITDKAYLFDPTDDLALANLIDTMLNDKIFVANCLNLNEIHSFLNDYSKRTRDAFVDTFDRIRADKSHSSNMNEEKVNQENIDNNKIAFFTPYPPMLNGVGIYTAHTVRELAIDYEIDVFTPPRSFKYISISNENIISIEKISNIESYKEAFYVIGNSADHKEIINLFIENGGGNLIIHDGRMFEFYLWVLGKEGMTRKFKPYLGDKICIKNIDEWCVNPGLLPSLFFEELLPLAKKIIVHSRCLKYEIDKMYNTNCYYLPMAYFHEFSDDELSEEATLQAKRRTGMSLSRLCLCTFGLITPRKGIEETIASIRDLKDWGIDVEYFLIGDASKDYISSLLLLSDELGVADRIKFVSYINDNGYYDYLQAADVALQFRVAPNGQLSGALNDCISAGLATITNEVLHVSTDAPEFVISIPNRISPLLISEAIYSIFMNNQHKNKVSPSRTEYLRSHSMSYYGKLFREIILN